MSINTNISKFVGVVFTKTIVNKQKAVNLIKGLQLLLLYHITLNGHFVTNLGYIFDGCEQ